MDSLLVSAPHKSSGKTTVTLGLCAALAQRGQQVQPFKKGPDYIDPMWLGQAAGRPCQNLDAYLMDDESLERCFTQALGGADIAIVEGNKGLYDGLALDGSNCNAALARLLGLPVLLVLDARGMTRGVAPLLLGFQAFERDIRRWEKQFNNGKASATARTAFFGRRRGLFLMSEFAVASFLSGQNLAGIDMGR